MAGKLSPGRLLAPLPKKNPLGLGSGLGNLPGASFLVHFID